ncbi:hypothetical protein FRC02_007463 [Tulasnella sp. 418]|nr:hypothetical protein FRC02_007463 [Tulasnella sp. 418]
MAICDKAKWRWAEQDITLWKVSTPINEGFDATVRNIKFKDNEELNPMLSLSIYYPSPPKPDYLHIIVQLPAAGNTISDRDEGNEVSTGRDDASREKLRNEIYEKIAIIKPHEKPRIEDIYTNNILIRDNPSDALRTSYAKKFEEQLTAKVLYDKSSEPLIKCLNNWLGDHISDHFIAATAEDDQENIATPQDLASYIRIAGKTTVHPLDYIGYTALAQELNLAGLVLDDAISVLKYSYNRDKDHSVILTKHSADATSYEKWYPKCDFSISFGERGNGYALLHGETDSQGQSAADSKYKNGLVSLHSWKVMNVLFGTEDHVILSAIISFSQCSIYIFYKDGDRFFLQCIFRESSLLSSPHQAVGFFRRMHNFAKIAKNHEEQTPEKQRPAEDVLNAITARATKRTTMGEEDEGNRGPGNSKRPHTAQGHQGTNYNYGACQLGA